ncbi:hypothetical protein FY145_10560 [Agrobacterium tumefaciens]|uniref:Uncharacterized protein n=1 Tax=Agrobacterium tumefaciens TaxID=358 RepID=A0AAP9J643_AGRTU|nr:hypothetical protein [Agrobacterium tumefaciens]NSZ58463.1 hypothetical protein [Agrobacterium tumefaciens]QDY94538.1 hypothetical protein CG010_010675 [Agrobacterium tumefaciens]UXS49665.1 hypothetical protein FY149_21005 [Agrobacterium tumefaciens]UXS70915.1 hypothetical protein FY146_10560 [Agrobacterium tumefaciens]UXS78578.1 hypothetical protein FY145_10560 [Agrobacterium tumefaciens]
MRFISAFSKAHSAEKVRSRSKAASQRTNSLPAAKESQEIVIIVKPDDGFLVAQAAGKSNRILECYSVDVVLITARRGAPHFSASPHKPGFATNKDGF